MQLAATNARVSLSPLCQIPSFSNALPHIPVVIYIYNGCEVSQYCKMCWYIRIQADMHGHSL